MTHVRRGRVSALAFVALALSAKAASRTAESLLIRTESGASALRVDLLDAGEPRVRLDLNDERALELEFVAREPAWGGGWIWRGSVAGDPLGSATISVLGDVAIGSVRTGHELWALEYAGHGLHRMRQVGEERMPTCAGAVAVPTSSSNTWDESQQLPLDANSSSPPTIDVLVVYTPQAKSDEGGTTPIQAKINLAIAETNQAYANSQVVQRLRLVYQFEAVGYVESGVFNTELSRLRVTNDGFLDNVHALRNQYGADVVSMMVADGSNCGIGYLMSPPSVSFQDRAFNVVSRTCATGYYSFGHELAHNMGCHHDRLNALGASPAYPYSYGYRTADGAWRTVMAYAPGTRIQYFSNPNLTFAGQVLGIADPSPVSAENWKTLNNTAAVVAQFRCAVPVTYGTSKTTSTGSVPLLTWTGTPSLASANLHVKISNGLAGKSVLVFYGIHQANAPWFGGTKYVAAPTLRLPINTFAPNGTVDFAFPTNGWTVGDTLFCQGWFRDPAHVDGTTVGLTNGLRVDFCP